MEPGGSLLCSQEYAAWVVYSLTLYFLKVQFNMILTLTLIPFSSFYQLKQN